MKKSLKSNALQCSLRALNPSSLPDKSPSFFFWMNRFLFSNFCSEGLYER